MPKDILDNLKERIERKLHEKTKKQIKEQREPIKEGMKDTVMKKKKIDKTKWALTGIQGFDDLLETGIPKGSSVLLCGGPGSGKTIFGLQTLYHGCKKGEKCLYMTFEENEKRLKSHMKDFGWKPEKYIKNKQLLIKRFDPFDITRQVEAMLEKAKGELLIDVKPIILPENFKPERVVVDSLSAIASAFVGKEESYRIYIEQLFRFLENTGATSFLISESTDVVKHLTQSGVEEFLADGVVVLYNIRHGFVRENGIEILKLRGAGFKKKIASMKIVPKEGIVVYPDQQVFTKIEL